MSLAPSPGGPPLVSIVITCFNYARYVAAAIDSALAQTYPRTEVIVVNDGSTDESSQVIGRYADRLRAIHQPNGGSVSALNTGFAASTGDLVMFLDADDLMAPQAVDQVARAWRPDCAKVQYDLTIIDGDGRDLGRRFCGFRPGYDARAVRDSFRRTATYRWPVTAGNAYARWFAAPLFPLTIPHGPDGTLNTLAPLYGDVVTIPRPLGSYRLHGHNMWSSGGSDLDRLPERIRHRRTEIARLQEHARRRGVSLPAGDPLDHELPFLHYRLAALKLGLDYPGKDADSAPRLMARAGRYGAERGPPAAAEARRTWAGSWRWGLRRGRLPRACCGCDPTVRRSRRPGAACWGGWGKGRWQGMPTQAERQGVDRAGAARSTVWSAVENGGLALVSFGSLVVYAQFLGPAEFGLFSIVLALVELLDVLVSMLFHDALVQKPVVTDRHFDTAFTASMLLGLMLLSACWLLAPAFAGLVHHDQAAAVLGWTALRFPFTALGATIVARQRRDLSFRVLALRSLVGRLGGAVLGIVLVALGAGVWGLVAQQVAIAGAASLVLWVGTHEPTAPAHRRSRAARAAGFRRRRRRRPVPQLRRQASVHHRGRRDAGNPAGRISQHRLSRGGRAVGHRRHGGQSGRPARAGPAAGRSRAPAQRLHLGPGVHLPAAVPVLLRHRPCRAGTGRIAVRQRAGWPARLSSPCWPCWCWFRPRAC